MDTIKNYIRYFKDVSFEESEFNDVDNIIFSSLVYLDLKNIVDKAITLKDAGKKFFNSIDYKELKKQPVLIRKIIDNFEILFTGKRYRDIVLFNYEKIVDHEKQFGALTYKLSDGTVYIAYEGTDDSLIGWKEDFDMFHKFPVPSQKKAIEYINKVVKFNTKRVIVGGHSKGGNLAIVSSMYARGYVKRKIIKIYNNDGPGLKDEQFNSKEYKQIVSKLKVIVPEESIIGLMLNHPNNYIVVKSNGLGLLQHSFNNWNCYGPIFIKGNLSENSKNMELKVSNWLNKHNELEIKKIVDTIFDILEKCEIKKLSELGKFNLSRFNKLIKYSRKLDKETKNLIIDLFKMLFSEK